LDRIRGYFIKSKSTEIAIRAFTGLVGRYLLCSSAGLPLLGLSRSDSVILGFSLAFPLYVFLQIWAFSARSLEQLVIHMTLFSLSSIFNIFLPWSTAFPYDGNADAAYADLTL
jgi:hypothetical protein